MLTALDLRGRASDAPTVAAFVDSLERAQREAPNHDGCGLDTEMGDLYYASLHAGGHGLVPAGGAQREPVPALTLHGAHGGGQAAGGQRRR
ncbi:hypothetical protein [Kitasatospora griseola]|uniref:hypothetical protein n=1 Tax=Kitasatospora griseola TaxID=2064 RepID=UPI0034395DCD